MSEPSGHSFSSKTRGGMKGKEERERRRGEKRRTPRSSAAQGETVFAEQRGSSFHPVDVSHDAQSPAWGHLGQRLKKQDLAFRTAPLRSASEEPRWERAV